MPDLHPIDFDEPAVRSPALAKIVESIRRQPPPEIGIDSKRVHEAFLDRRHQRRVTLLAGGAMAAAAAAIFALVQPSPGDRPVHPTPVAARTDSSSPAVGASTNAVGRDTAVGRAPMLADAVRIEKHIEGSPDPEVVGPWAVMLREGGYRIEVFEGEDGPLRISLPSIELELAHGIVLVLLTGPEPEIQLQSGRAVLIDDDGDRVALAPITEPAERSRPAARTKRAAPTAAELARRAEALLAAGDRDGAMETLHRLVTAYPSSSAARAGLLDLARLYKSVGRRDEARCAYGAYLDRWPYTQLRTEIESALDRLGGPLDCVGVSPK